MYYADKLETLRELFGNSDVALESGRLRVGDRSYPIVDDVIVLLDSAAAADARPAADAGPALAKDIQYTFGAEWQAYPKIMPEHEAEFRSYFDLVDLSALANARVGDFGCGMGRWSYFLKDQCRELVLVDFSEAIFVARKNLADCPRALFFRGDLTRLPFRKDSLDLIARLGVLHHLPIDALDATRALARFAPRVLVYLYYGFDNRPFHYALLFQVDRSVRSIVCRIRDEKLRHAFVEFATWVFYMPLITLGRLAQLVGMGRHVPLYDFYHDKSVPRIRQDVYDRFFTRIAQRFTRAEIRQLSDTFSRIEISERLPYWHFLCSR